MSVTRYTSGSLFMNRSDSCIGDPLAPTLLSASAMSHVNTYHERVLNQSGFPLSLMLTILRYHSPFKISQSYLPMIMHLLRFSVLLLIASQSDYVFSSPTRDVRSLITNEKHESVVLKGQDAAMVHGRALMVRSNGEYEIRKRWVGVAREDFCSAINSYG